MRGAAEQHVLARRSSRRVSTASAERRRACREQLPAPQISVWPATPKRDPFRSNGTSRAIARSSVVLPAPFGPISPTHSPSGDRRRRPRRPPARPPSSPTRRWSSIALIRTCHPSIAARARRTARRRTRSRSRSAARPARPPCARRRRRGRGTRHRRSRTAGAAPGSRPARSAGSRAGRRSRRSRSDRLTATDRSRPDRRRDDQHQPHAPHVDAEARRLVVAEVQDVDARRRRTRITAVATTTYGSDDRPRRSTPSSAAGRGSTSRPPGGCPRAAAARTPGPP